ncbi:hypothetical protein ACS0TY_005927 [Phlomoides rotata]
MGDGAISVKRRRRETGANVQENGVKIVKRSSRFRGVSRHRWTGRYEAHLWDKLSWNVTQKKKGKQGAYDDEEAAARAYDLAALKYWGTSTFTNFPISDYEKEIEIMQTLTKEEYLASLRRKSSGFSRGVSKYRGVARHHHNGRWEARIGRVFGNKYLYLGTYGTQEEAARAYDVAAIAHRGINAVTNFDMNTYVKWLKPEPNIWSPSHEIKPSIQLSHQQPLSSFFPIKKSPSENQIKQEMQESTIPFNYCRKPSSPTALDLLLRSSVFRELVEKNSTASEEESSDDENGKNVGQSEYEGSFYGGVPLVFSSGHSYGNQLHERRLYYSSTSDVLGMTSFC